ANPIHTPDPSGKVDPNPHYMAMRIMQSRPELVLTFGNNAKQGLEQALQTLAPRHRVESMHCKHPNARFFPQHDLNLFAATVLTFQVPWDKNPRYNDTFHR